jgi:ABC-type polysaccharide/polyol phosphate transport system ATPase subunit
MTTDDTTVSPPAPAAAPGAGGPLAIQVEDLHKSFRIPTNRVDSLKERAVRPFASREYRELRALDGISFDVRKGEFFGIVGRNGSGKSTLLKLLASIYRADSGTLRMAGRLAPFIELGVGFNHDLTARENVVLNGVMMGLTPKEMRRRLDAVIEFAELGEFADLKLKNYSSGMMVRLAFSVMMEADADVLLIDEVLAVGDASFQQKCADAFHEMKAAGKTIVLVTHEMATVEEYCHRAMLISDGKIDHIGDPAEVGRRYLRLNFEHGGTDETAAEQEPGDLGTGSGEVELVDAWLESSDGERVKSVEQGKEIQVRVELAVRRDVPSGLDVGFVLANADGLGVSQFGTPVRDEGWSGVSAGQRVLVTANFENPLAPGRYFVHCGINRGDSTENLLFVKGSVDFVVFGAEVSGGLVSLQHVLNSFIGEDEG